MPLWLEKKCRISLSTYMTLSGSHKPFRMCRSLADVARLQSMAGGNWKEILATCGLFDEAPHESESLRFT